MTHTSLQAILQANMPMPFVSFMQQALYAPYVGYYSSNLPKLGRMGDFTTAPEMTPLFGHALAYQCQQVLQTVPNPCIFEFGAGSGQLCLDILTHLEHLGCLPECYYILDVSSYLQQQQKQLIKDKIPHLLNRVQWLNSLPETPINGVILANEVLDSMPVYRFMQTDAGLLESYIQTDEQGVLSETFRPCDTQDLITHVESLTLTNRPYLSEANLFIPGWIQACYNLLHQGALLIIDYGFPRHEYYHPDRNQGTLMCHYQHQAHTNFLAHPGEEDITAHVDFTHVAEAAHQAGFEVAGYTNQAAFLLANGILDHLGKLEDNTRKFQNTQAVKQLLHPEEMGELFKVIALTKDIAYPLQGFQLADKRRSL